MRRFSYATTTPAEQTPESVRVSAHTTQIAVPAAVLFDGSLTPTARLLYAYLLAHGPCTIGYRRLTRETGCGREALETGIAMLELRKLITRQRAPRRATTYTAVAARRNDVGIAVPDLRAATSGTTPESAA